METLGFLYGYVVDSLWGIACRRLCHGSVEELVADGVRELARRTRFPVAFGGLIEDGVVRVTSIVGNRTHSLDGLNVRPERGLGGRAMIELRPRMTNN